jgi:hypothetical protein
MVLPADLANERAPWCEEASRQLFADTRHPAGDWHERIRVLAHPETRHAGEESSRIGMLRGGEKLVRRAFFDELACIENPDAIADA